MILGDDVIIAGCAILIYRLRKALKYTHTDNIMGGQHGMG